jgi:hypothetical protein
MQPYVLLWLRYTAFIVLYPLGVSSELAEVALALPTIRATRPWSIQVGAAGVRAAWHGVGAAATFVGQASMRPLNLRGRTTGCCCEFASQCTFKHQMHQPLLFADAQQVQFCV